MVDSSLNFNLIDPNKEILKGTKWYNTDESGLGIPNFEDIRSYVELKMKPKNPNFIELEKGQIVGSSSNNDTSKITLGGFYQRNGENYYSTNYTDEIMGGNQSENNRYEGFGIKNIDVTFDANKIPQVTIIFYDVRGNVLNNFNSPFAKMFQLPYPIFELTIKGGFGPKITYRLLKIKDNISIDEFGNYIITSNFIGDRFAPFSDLPLLYLFAVPFLKNIPVNVFDTEIKSFLELMISSKGFYTKLNQENESPQELNNQKEFTKLSDERTSNNDKLNILRNKETLLSWFNDDILKPYTQKTKDSIINYINGCVIGEKQIIFNPSPSILLNGQTTTGNKEFHTLITNTIKENVITLDDKQNLVIVNTNLSALNPSAPFDLTEVTQSIDYTKLINRIQENDNQIRDKGIEFDNNRKIRIENLASQSFGETKLTIGNIFKFIIDDYNFLMTQIKEVGERGLNQGRSGYDKIGFPTVIQDKVIIYPGQNILFKDWPEVVFIEQFIDAYYKSLKSSAISDALLNTNEDGSSRYIPINPREVYQLNDNQPSMNSVGNVYFGKEDVELFNLIYERFLSFTNINLNLDKSSNVYSTWNGTQSSESSFDESMKSFFGLTDINDDKIQQGLFYSTIEMEARNIAHAISLNDKIKKYITQLSKRFNNSSFFNNNKNDLLTLGIKPISNNTLSIPNSLKPFDDDYVTVSNVEPTLINSTSQGTDIISNYMKSLNDLNTGYKVTKDNVLYIEDTLLNGGTNESDYDNRFLNPFGIEGKDDSYLKGQIENSTQKRIYTLYDIEIDVIAFNLDDLYYNCRYTSLVQVPRGILVLLGSVVRSLYNVFPTDQYYKISVDIRQSNKIFNIKNGSKFFNYIKKESEDFDNKFGFLTNYSYNNDSFEWLKCNRVNFTIEDKKILEYLYGKAYISVNDLRFTSDNITQNITNGITDPTKTDQTLYVQYLKILLPKIAQFVKEDDEKLNQKLKSFSSYVKDPQVKLAIYKSFQVIYENYLHGVKDFTLQTVGSNSSFAFVDRGYNDISNTCILDIKTLLNDINDYEVSLLSSMSRLLADNNFWFYPFQNFFTTKEGYDELFSINYDKETPINPLIVAMYVGALSSNPKNTNEYSVSDDGIKKDDIPEDFKQSNTYSNGVLNAFSVKYTGIQNQAVFSNVQVSTESLKNTDEGLRIQSEIVNNASNSFSIPKGQSLLNVYQKQSYSSTIKIPFGNMGIQPTQYYYQEFIPLFDGLYIIFNVSHSIDADTQRLETTFKGYRLKKDTNPIVTEPFVDFINDSIYKQTLNDLGIVQAQSTAGPIFVENEDFFVNARRFVRKKEGFVAHCYWDIDNWRIGYGSQVLALNASLKATGNDRFNDKYFITLPNNPTKWPQNVDLDTGQINPITLPVNHVKEYRYFTDRNGNVQWDAARNIKNDQYKAYVKDFYSTALSDRAFDYTFNKFVQTTKRVNPTGFEKLTDKGKIGATYISYGFGSIKPFMTKIKAAISSGNDTQLAIAMIDDLATKEGNWSKQIYYDTAKYINPNILSTLTQTQKTALNKFKVSL